MNPMDKYKCKNGNFIVDKKDANGKGTLFSSFRSDINNLMNARDQRMCNMTSNLKKVIAMAYDEDVCHIMLSEDDADIYMHIYVINAGYASSIIALSDYMLDENRIKESNIYNYEGVDGLLFPLLFVCEHAIEIGLKTFIYAHGDSYKNSHKITELLTQSIDLCVNTEAKDILLSYSDFINELNTVTNDGFAMRYALDRTGKNYLKFTYIIDINKLRDTTIYFLTFISRFAYGHYKYF